MIDPHVHCRDGNQAYKETIAHVLELAKEQGIEKVFDMPNTDPPIISEADVIERLKLVPEERKGDYFLYIGATSNPKQLEEAVSCYNSYPEVIGIKLYAGKSVGNLAVVNFEEQRLVYKTLSSLNYQGIITVHCEKESLLKPELWNPSNPITHSYARPKEAEIESVKDQINLAKETDFNGILHICHVSCPESVELIEPARKDIHITCGVTPHHLIWNNKMQTKKRASLAFKINPPLREKEDVHGLRKYLREGKIDWIETDHAPHSDEEKFYPPYLSGFPSLRLYKDLVLNFLPTLGLNEEQIRRLTYENILQTFKQKLSQNFLDYQI